VVGLFRDNTVRRQAEELLRQSEERYRKLVETAPDAIYFISAEDREIKLLNPAFEKITGWKTSEWIGKSFASIVHPDDLPLAVETFKQVLEGKSPPLYELRILSKSGEYITGEFTSMPFGEGDKVVGEFGIVRDVTERKLSEEATRRLNAELTKTNKKLHQMALKDTQTGLYNHRYLTEIIESEFYRAKRYGSPISVVMLDLDYFKSINDVYGHNFGDIVLGQLANLFNRTVRNYDIVTRFGGEEFVFILPDTDPKGAMMLAHRILDKISLHSFGTSKQIVHLKASLGVVTYPQDKVLVGMDLVNLADQLLNKVKDRGGNNVYSTLDTGRKEDPLENTEESESESIKYMQEKINRLTKRANRSLMEAIFAFARTIELKDHYTGEHVEKTVYYAVEMAKALGLLNEEIEKIRDAAMLHDLGKIGISEKILLKKSKLTPKEFMEIKKHPQIGADIIRPIHFMHDIIPLILYHHERYDGKGYLNGLKGEQIPIGARIIAVADVYQALTSNRPYRKAYSKKEATEMIKNGAGTQFDPHIVDVFLGILSK
ncbi:MAG: diguanylate cyclase, partial [Candidatus Omnitrophica bacterium]|nr:diguanylate cyclase [Candidatus Omnitrophota bacterium]